MLQPVELAGSPNSHHPAKTARGKSVPGLRRARYRLLWLNQDERIR
jgi:hypothetical protein